MLLYLSQYTVDYEHLITALFLFLGFLFQGVCLQQNPHAFTHIYCAVMCILLKWDRNH